MRFGGRGGGYEVMTFGGQEVMRLQGLGEGKVVIRS